MLLIRAYSFYKEQVKLEKEKELSTNRYDVSSTLFAALYASQ